MDVWLKAKADKLAQAAQKHVSKLEQSLDPTKTGKESSCLKELKFGQGPLGFIIDGMHITSVEKGTQAARLGVEAGDRLVMVDGRAVPDFELDDADDKARAETLVKGWMSKMPLPAMLVFAPATPPPSEGELEDDTDVAVVEGAANVELSEGAEEHGGMGAGLDTGWELEADDDLIHPGNCVENDPEQAVAEEIINPIENMEPTLETPVDLLGLQAELQHERGARLQLSTELKGTRLAQTKAVSALEAERKQSAARQKQVAELQKQLAGAKAENKELSIGQGKSEAEAAEALEKAEARERELKEEILRIKKDNESGGVAAHAAADAATKRAEAAEGRVAELQATISKQAAELEESGVKKGAADVRAETAELQVDSLRRQFSGFREAHETEIELLHKDQQMKETLHRGRLEELERKLKEQEEKTTTELAQVRQELDVARRSEAAQRRVAEDAQAKAEAAVAEAAGARKEAAAAASFAETPKIGLSAGEDIEPGDRVAGVPRTPGASKEVNALYDRIDHLEQRCTTLQKKLRAQPIVSQGQAQLYCGDQGAAVELFVTSLAGPRVGTLAAKVYNVPDCWLRNFTQLLLRRDVWRWAFYAHLAMLYTFSSGFFAQASMDPGSPVDQINAQMAAAARASGPPSASTLAPT